MVRADEAVVRVLQVWLECDNRLLSYIFYLFHKITHVLALAHQVLDYRRK